MYKDMSTSVLVVVRALQLIFAIIVIGTDAYDIHQFRGKQILVQSVFGNFDAYEGVPASWGFLIFCAAWTILVVIFLAIANKRLGERAWDRYLRLGLEAVAFLSWLAGFIAVAISVSNRDCQAGQVHCGALEAATVFGALEWLLFLFTAGSAGSPVFNDIQTKRRTQRVSEMVVTRTASEQYTLQPVTRQKSDIPASFGKKDREKLGMPPSYEKNDLV